MSKTRERIVKPYGFNMLCEYEYDPGEPPIWFPIDRAHPGTPASAVLLTCVVGGANIMQMLSPKQVETIEDAILSEEG